MTTDMKAIDLFSGAGGFTEGAVQAGCDVLWAANHWPEAVTCHAANHQGTDHACQDLHQANWEQVPRHDLLLASPCCQGHSPARGKLHNNPQHDASRSTAWVVPAAAEFHKPAAIIVENVPEFRGWVLYPAWCMAMEALGYSIAPYIIDAADHGVPQNRVRLFLVMTRSRNPVQLHLRKRDHAPARTFIDFTAGAWSPIAKPGRSRNTLERVEAGRRRYGERFVMPYYGSGSGKTGRDLDRPIGTLTTRDRWAVVDGDRMRMLTVDESKAGMSFPQEYRLPPNQRLAKHLLGNAVCPGVARDVISAVRGAL